MKEYKNLIELVGLKKIYGSSSNLVIALKNINLNIAEGEYISIMGPSGSGKSTLMHILGLLDRHSDGLYKFKGKDVREFNDEELSKIRNKEIGFIFQSFNLLSRMTVFENIKLPLLYSDSVAPEHRNEIVDRLIDLVKLTHRKHHYPSQLSGGEQQRVAIARALVNSPSIIFADEPTGNLDSRAGEIVMQTLQDLNDKGQTIIVVTHESSTAQYAKRIILIKDGELKDDVVLKHRLLIKPGAYKK